ncbi:MAG: hypothetical protein KBT03_04150 [Bacteroidales bacterium]|nr:hypothetical protein [Candidatus Scybalousia scybalohippi]
MSVSAETLALSKKYTNDSISGISGVLAGKNCTIQSSTKEDGITTIVFGWVADDGTEKTTSIQVKDGLSVVNATINDEGHLIITMTDGSKIDAGYISVGEAVNYNLLENKPSINGVSLVGSKESDDFGLIGSENLKISYDASTSKLYLKNGENVLSEVTIPSGGGGVNTVTSLAVGKSLNIVE